MRRQWIMAAVTVAIVAVMVSTAAPARAECAGVIITELMYNPDDHFQGQDATDEWVEIYNDGCDSVDLTGWTIGDSAAMDPLTPMDGSSALLAPRQYALIIDGTDSTVLSNPSWSIPAGTPIFGTGDSSIGHGLSNVADTVTLRDALGNVVDEVSYEETSESGCGAAADGSGWSLERVDPLGPGDCTNFRSDELAESFPVGGTPGSQNYLWSGSACSCSPLSVDNYKCYGATGHFDFHYVPLADRFGVSGAFAFRPAGYCSAVDLDTEGVSDPSIHLTCYDILEWPHFPGASVDVSNVFGEQTLLVGKGRQLCVPTVRLNGERNQNQDRIAHLRGASADDFKCYEARATDHGTRSTVYLEEQLRGESVTVRSAAALCTAANVNQEGTANPDANLGCYRLNASNLPNVEMLIYNRFGYQQIRVNAARYLCVPTELP